ncbi:MAG: ABC transporter ATP-binding protein [Geminicoccaceae bacterium]
MTAILEIDRLTRRFGGLTALDNLSFKVRSGAIHGLIGPNGAGKTTTFNVISGFYPPSSGRVLFLDRDISGLSADRIGAAGMVRTFQHTTLFKELTVLDNVLVGGHLRAQTSLWSMLMGKDRDLRDQTLTAARETLDFFGLADRQHELAAALPHGLQRALGMAVALAAEPRFLLLDEPFTGMNAEETRQMMALIRTIRDQGMTILLVEHDMKAVMSLCDRITVLSFGRRLAEGTPDEIKANPDVIEAYLGAPNEARDS